MDVFFSLERYLVKPVLLNSDFGLKVFLMAQYLGVEIALCTSLDVDMMKNMLITW